MPKNYIEFVIYYQYIEDKCKRNMVSHDRPAGLLTIKQRKFLDDEYDLDQTPSGEWRMEKRIRERLRNAVFDMAFINEHMDQKIVMEALVSNEELSKQVEIEDEPTKGPEDDSVELGRDPDAKIRTVVPNEQRAQVRELMGFDDLEFGYLSPEIVAARTELVVFLYRITGNMRAFETTVEGGVEEIFSRYMPDILLQDVNLELKEKHKKKLVASGSQKMRHDDPLTPAEVQALLESPEHDDGEVGEYVRTQN